MLNDGFELTPNYMNRLDMSTYLNDGEIEHVEMEEKTLTSINDEDEQTKVRIYTRSRLYGHRIYGLFGLYGQCLSGPNLPEYTKN